jgi:hypothetical protein
MSDEKSPDCLSMATPLCHLVSVPSIWGSNVLSFLSLKGTVSVDTAFLVRRFRSDLFQSYRALPPVALPPQLSIGIFHALKWLFRRGGSLQLLRLEAEYVEFGREHAHIIMR